MYVITLKSGINVTFEDKKLILDFLDGIFEGLLKVKFTDSLVSVMKEAKSPLIDIPAIPLMFYNLLLGRYDITVQEIAAPAAPKPEDKPVEPKSEEVKPEDKPVEPKSN